MISSAHREGLRGWFVVNERHLFEIDFRDRGDGEVRQLDPWVGAYARYDHHRIAWVSAGQEALLSNVGFEARSVPPPLPENVVDDVVLGPWHPRHPWPSFGYRTHEDRIAVFGMRSTAPGMRPSPLEVTIERGSRLVGLTSRYIDATNHTPIPIVLDGNRILRSGDAEPIVIASSPIAATRWYPTNEILVWRTKSGEVGVDAVNPAAARLRLRPEGGGA